MTGIIGANVRAICPCRRRRDDGARRTANRIEGLFGGRPAQSRRRRRFPRRYQFDCIRRHAPPPPSSSSSSSSSPFSSAYSNQLTNSINDLVNLPSIILPLQRPRVDFDISSSERQQQTNSLSISNSIRVSVRRLKTTTCKIWSRFRKMK